VPVSKANINWTACSYTPVSASIINLTRISNGSFNYGGKLIKFSGDTDQYPTIIATPLQDPSASFTSADVGTFFGIVPNTVGVLAATLNDARSASGGAVVFSMANAVFENSSFTAAHAQFASITATWQAYSSDGVTPPLSFTRI
jgi:hypothetical protein